LGRGIARAFAEAGAAVVALARSGPALAELATTSANIRTEVADAADATVAWRALDQYEPEVLILVAGANPVVRPLQEQTWETFSLNWQSDVKIAFTWLREALLKPLRPGSRVVVVSSAAAIDGSPASGGYAGSKATVRFIAAYAQEEARRGGLEITVTAVMPSMTPFGEVGRRRVRAYARRGGQSEEAYLKQLGELLRPEMAGSALVDLVSQTRRALPPSTCSAPPGCTSCHEGRRGSGCPSVPRSRPHCPSEVCGAGASLCLSDVQPRLGISALRDTRKMVMVGGAWRGAGRSDGGWGDLLRRVRPTAFVELARGRFGSLRQKAAVALSPHRSHR
jgi:NAD(P)-dependent dehydrogenase (short-subunit alcohol dehydrogenase family)